MKKVLIFYSKTGGGHLRTAEALVEEINRHPGYQVVLYDGLEKTNWGHNIKPDLLFFLLSHYGLSIYNLFYRLTDNPYGLLILRSIIKVIWGKSFKQIIESEKPDLIISTHHFISPSTVRNSKKVPYILKKIPYILVVTDLGKPHQIWFDDGADQIIVPNKYMAKWASHKFNIPETKIKSLGYPLKKHFRQKTRVSFSNQLLFVGTGISPAIIKNWIKHVKKYLPDKKIVIICGHNRVLQKSLKSLGEDIQVFGFVDNLHHFLNRADILISKAGPGIVMEAAALKRPIIITKWLGNQEKDNIDFVVLNNLGVYDPNGKNLIENIHQIYKNYRKYTNNQKVISYDTKKIVNQLLNF